MSKIVVGRLGKAYGVFGWVKLQSFTDPAKNILDYSPFYIKKSANQWQSLAVESTKFHDQQLLIKFKEFNNPETAKLYANIEIYVERDQLPKLKKQEYYWVDLIGCKVKDLKGNVFGKVTTLFETGSNDVLVVETKDQRHLIPYLDHVITDVDLAQKLITVDWDQDF